MGDSRPASTAYWKRLNMPCDGESPTRAVGRLVALAVRDGVAVEAVIKHLNNPAHALNALMTDSKGKPRIREHQIRAWFEQSASQSMPHYDVNDSLVAIENARERALSGLWTKSFDVDGTSISGNAVCKVFLALLEMAQEEPNLGAASVLASRRAVAERAQVGDGTAARGLKLLVSLGVAVPALERTSRTNRTANRYLLDLSQEKLSGLWTNDNAVGMVSHRWSTTRTAALPLDAIVRHEAFRHGSGLHVSTYKAIVLAESTDAAALIDAGLGSRSTIYERLAKLEAACLIDRFDDGTVRARPVTLEDLDAIAQVNGGEWKKLKQRKRHNDERIQQRRTEVLERAVRDGKQLRFDGVLDEATGELRSGVTPILLTVFRALNIDQDEHYYPCPDERPA